MRIKNLASSRFKKNTKACMRMMLMVQLENPKCQNNLVTLPQIATQRVLLDQLPYYDRDCSRISDSVRKMTKKLAWSAGLKMKLMSGQL